MVVTDVPNILGYHNSEAFRNMVPMVPISISSVTGDGRVSKDVSEDRGEFREKFPALLESFLHICPVSQLRIDRGQEFLLVF